jgi:hypothetical protein
MVQNAYPELQNNRNHGLMNQASEQRRQQIGDEWG